MTATTPIAAAVCSGTKFWFRVENLRAAGVSVYRVPFDAAEPIDTPRDLDSSLPELSQAFAAAVRSVAESGFAVDAPRSAFSYRQGTGGDPDRIAVPGGYQRTGAFTIAQSFAFSRGGKPNLQPKTAYGPLSWGNSYMQIVSYDAQGALRASTFMTYGQSSDPASPHYDDCTRLYSAKQWLHASFTESEVSADTQASSEFSGSR